MGKRISSLQEKTTVTSNDYLAVDNPSEGVKKLSADFINDIVTDVTVDGTSVVDDGIADIDLSGKQDVLTAGTNIDITNGVISATDTTYSDMGGATTSTGGTHGLVPAPLSGDNTKFLRGDATWADAASALSELTDTNIGTPTDGQVLKYDATNNEWINDDVDTGTDVTVTQIQSTGTKIATVTVDDVDTDLYAPSGGSTNSYGYNTPSDSEGVNGDIYCKIANVSGQDECIENTITLPTATWTTVPLLKSANTYTTLTISGISNNASYSYSYDVNSIGDSSSTATDFYITINSGKLKAGVMYKSGASIVMLKQSGANVSINSLIGVFTSAHSISNAYQKIDNIWVRYEDETGSEVIANPQGTATDTLNTVEIDGTVYDIEGGGGSSLILDAQRYSLDEQVIGTWIDGKTLYQKVLDFNSTTINARVDHDVSSLNIETLVDYKGWAQRITGSSEKYILKDGCVLTSGGYTYSFYVRYYATGKQIQTTLTLPSGESTDRQVVIIQYTKTT